MNTIEFSHNYTKLPAGIKTAVLVAVEPVKLLDLSHSFIQYDTEFRVPTSYGYDVLYNMYLKRFNEDMLCLILKSDSGAIFTTLRKDNSENREKYMKYVGHHQTAKRDYEPRYGKEFQIIIKEG